MDEVIINRIFFIIIIILIALLYFSVDENIKLTDFFARTKLDFKTETIAVCEEIDGGTFCKDQVFVTCGGIKQKIIDVNGSIMVLDKSWQDKR